MSFSLCLDYILFFDFVAVISIATFQDLIRSAKEYEDYSDYLTTASYDELIAQIRNAEGVVNSEINTDKLDEILNSDEITNIDRNKPRMVFLRQ